MLSIGLVSSAAAARTYFTGEGAGCPAGYYGRDGEPLGRWAGTGAAGLGLSGGISGQAGMDVFAKLLEGVGPDGQRLVAAVRRGDPRARVPAAPLVAAVRAVALETGLPVTAMLGSAELVRTWGRLAGGLTAGRRRASPGVRADDAARVAAAVGLDPHAVYRAAVGDGTDPLAAALAHVGARVDVRRAGYDLTFSAPKSVSLLHALGGPGVAGEVAEAHARAWQDAVAYLESVAGHVARGHHGDGARATRIGTTGFVAAAFDHGTSRAGDPQLHTHVVVVNLLQGVDGGWSAVDSRALHRHARTAGFVYQAVLRGELTARLGVQWQPVERGTAEIRGVAPRVLRLFSTRRRQITAAMDKRGVEGAAAAQQACLATRPGKDRTASPVDLARRWRERLAAGGIDADMLVAGMLEAPGYGEVHGTDPASLSARLLSPVGLTRNQSSFDRDAVLRGVCEHVDPGAPLRLADLKDLADRVLEDPDAIPLRGHGPRDAGSGDAVTRRRWSARCLLDVEAAALADAAALRGRPGTRVGESVVTALCDAHHLPDEQAAMVAALCSGVRSLTVVIGPAGAGKTAALRAATRAWSASGVPVLGVTLAGLAGRGLAQATGMRTHTLRQLQNELSHSGTSRLWPPGPAVLVVDEAGMVGTRDLAQLLRHASRRPGMHLVLVGDDRQLPEIEAGGLFAALAQDPGTVRLEGNQRQTAAWERRALGRLRDGQVPEAIEAYLEHDRVRILGSAEELNDVVATDYLRLRFGDRGARIGVLAATRAQAASINDLIRERLAARGWLTGPELEVTTPDGPRGMRTGDVVMVTAPDHERGLLNGQLADVTGVDHRRGSLTVRVDDGRTLVLGPDWLGQGRLAHGYVVTVHKGQGQTHDVTLVAGSTALDRGDGVHGDVAWAPRQRRLPRPGSQK